MSAGGLASADATADVVPAADVGAAELVAAAAVVIVVFVGAAVRAGSGEAVVTCDPEGELSHAASESPTRTIQIEVREAEKGSFSRVRMGRRVCQKCARLTSEMARLAAPEDRFIVPEWSARSSP